MLTTLSIEELEVEYQLRDKTIHAVDKVSLFLKNNESLGIVGESACGKSTLGLAIIRSVPGGKIVNGDVTLDGKSMLKMTEAEFAKTVRWKKISMVFQGAMNSLDPVFSIRQQFEETLQAHDYRGDRLKMINDVIDSVGLPPTVLDKFPHELSGGMKQRVVIAMALILRPNLVIADEPTTALDVLVQAQILSLLKKLNSYTSIS